MCVQCGDHTEQTTSDPASKSTSLTACRRGCADEEEELNIEEMVRKGEVAWLDREDAPETGADPRNRPGLPVKAEDAAGQARIAAEQQARAQQAQQAPQRSDAPAAGMQQGMQVC